MVQTNHSRIRKSQRGILQYHFSFLIEYGSEFSAPGGARKIAMIRKDIRAAISKKKREIQVLSNLSVLTAIIDGDDILTVYK